MATAVMTTFKRIHDGLGHLIRELLKFDMVDGVAFTINVNLFNLLLHHTDKPLTSKTVSTVITTTITYVDNRLWTFRHQTHSKISREYNLFFLLNAVKLAITLNCLATSHYLLGFTNQLADNITANIVGLILGTTFQF